MQIKQLGRLLRLAVDERDADFAASRHLRLATLDVAVSLGPTGSLERNVKCGVNGRSKSEEKSRVQLPVWLPVGNPDRAKAEQSGGPFHLCVHRWGKSGETGGGVASWMFSCHFGCHLRL
jgi:hypothetical protein